MLLVLCSLAIGELEAEGYRTGSPSMGPSGILALQTTKVSKDLYIHRFFLIKTRDDLSSDERSHDYA